MATMPGVELRLLPPGVNHTSGGMGAIHGVVLHVIVGSLGAADGAFHSPAWQASAHFGVDFDGHAVQWVDTSDKAWAEAAGNPSWISVETAGTPDTALTEPQVGAMARILRWAHDTHGGFALAVTDDVNGQGLGVHYMGGQAWGGHSCPGPIRAGQRAEIVRRASGAPAPQPAPTPAPATEEDDVSQFLKGDQSATVYEVTAGAPPRPVKSESTLADLAHLGHGKTPPLPADIKTVVVNGVTVGVVSQRLIDELL